MKRIFILVLALVMLSGCAARLDKTSEFLQYKDRARIAEIEKLCAAFFEENGLIGMSVGVLVDGSVRFFNYGVTETGGTKITEDTRFDLGTLTQVFTGVTFSESIYRRYLSDGSQLEKIFPYLRLAKWQDGTGITYGQLATHRSGMPSAPSNLGRGSNPYEDYTEQDLRKFIASSKLQNRPGDMYNPVGMDMGLLGFAVEVARKTPFEYHVKSVIMYSINMTRTTITIEEDDMSPRAVPHNADGKALPHQDYASLQGMAGFKSTAYDMLLFAWSNMDMPGTEGTFTKEEAQGWSLEQQLYMSLDTAEKKAQFAKLIGAQSVLERLHASMVIARDEHYSDGEVSLGYGFCLGELDGNQYVWQTGGGEGNGGYIGFIPDASTGVAILANSPVDAQPLALEIFSVLK